MDDNSTDLLCTTCWSVPSCKHYVDPHQSTDPERWQPHHLCLLCARTWAPLRSRWSWLACANCRALNLALRDAYGAFLPLGRHSIMNGGSVRVDEPDAGIRARQQEHLGQVLGGMRDLWDWKRQQAQAIQATLMPAEYRTATRIPMDVWTAHAQPSWEASCAAWLAYNELADFDELQDRMLRIYAAGRLPWPDFISTRGWLPEGP